MTQGTEQRDKQQWSLRGVLVPWCFPDGQESLGQPFHQCQNWKQVHHGWMVLHLRVEGSARGRPARQAGAPRRMTAQSTWQPPTLQHQHLEMHGKLPRVSESLGDTEKLPWTHQGTCLGRLKHCSSSGQLRATGAQTCRTAAHRLLTRPSTSPATVRVTQGAGRSGTSSPSLDCSGGRQRGSSEHSPQSPPMARARRHRQGGRHAGCTWGLGWFSPSEQALQGRCEASRRQHNPAAVPGGPLHPTTDRGHQRHTWPRRWLTGRPHPSVPLMPPGSYEASSHSCWASQGHISSSFQMKVPQLHVSHTEPDAQTRWGQGPRLMALGPQATESTTGRPCSARCSHTPPPTPMGPASGRQARPAHGTQLEAQPDPAPPHPQGACLSLRLTPRLGVCAHLLTNAQSHGQRSLAGYSPWGHRESTQLSDYTHARWEQVLVNKSKAPGGGGSLGYHARVQEGLREFGFTGCLLEGPF